VKAGTYTLYAIPGKTAIIINKDLNVWGSYFIKANDVARLKPVTTAADSLEALSMVLQRAIAVLF
jgi:hypothetical protein